MLDMNVLAAEQLIFEAALRIARKAAANEVLCVGGVHCLELYQLARSLLEALLVDDVLPDNDVSPKAALSPDSKAVVRNYIRAVVHRAQLVQ